MKRIKDYMTNSSITISAPKNLPENPTENLPEKQCTKCGGIFPLTEEFFNKNRTQKDGFQTCCKSCQSKQNKEYRANNKEYFKEYFKEYHQSNKHSLKEYRQRNKNYFKEYHKEYRQINKDKLMRYKKEYRKNNKESLKAKNNFPYLFNSLLSQKLSIYEETRESQDGYIEARCAYCGKWIQPTVSQVRNRISACETHGNGECRIYCNDNNDQCKLACPTYHKISYPKGFKPASSREVDPLVRQLCFERDNWTCQHCGVTSKEAQLHCHHIIGVVHSPMEQNDISNTITLCKACHKALHKQKGCRYQDYKCA